MCIIDVISWNLSGNEKKAPDPLFIKSSDNAVTTVVCFKAPYPIRVSCSHCVFPTVMYTIQPSPHCVFTYTDRVNIIHNLLGFVLIFFNIHLMNTGEVHLKMHIEIAPYKEVLILILSHIRFLPFLHIFFFFYSYVCIAFFSTNDEIEYEVYFRHTSGQSPQFLVSESRSCCYTVLCMLFFICTFFTCDLRVIATAFVSTSCSIEPPASTSCLETFWPWQGITRRRWINTRRPSGSYVRPYI